MATIATQSRLAAHVYELKNYIKRFDQHGQPVFDKAYKRWKISEVCGREIRLEGKTRRFISAAMHTNHTVSIFKVAHAIRDELRTLPLCRIQRQLTTRLKHVDISNARCIRRRKEANKMWLDAVHRGQRVVLKTTTDGYMQLVYIIEAMIHEIVAIRCPQYIPKLHFVGFATGNRLVVCSEQLTIPSVGAFLYALRLKPRKDPNIVTWRMVRAVLQAIQRLQRTAQFTHRDCHIANVHYDGDTGRVRFIDFDWSCIKWLDKTISVPKHLYDTTRSEYGYNKSVDCCVFMRSLQAALEHVPVFRTRVYDPLMGRYSDMTGRFLKQRAGSDPAALQLYRSSSETRTIDSEYSHRYGVERYGKSFDYLMGHYTWPSMTPGSILEFMDDHRFF